MTLFGGVRDAPHIRRQFCAALQKRSLHDVGTGCCRQRESFAHQSDKEERADMRVDEEDFISNINGLNASASQGNQADAEAVISAAIGSVDEYAARRMAGPISFSNYVATQFLPGHVALKSSPGKRHYFAILKHVIKPSERKSAGL